MSDGGRSRIFVNPTFEALAVTKSDHRAFSTVEASIRTMTFEAIREDKRFDLKSEENALDDTSTWNERWDPAKIDQDARDGSFHMLMHPSFNQCMIPRAGFQ